MGVTIHFKLRAPPETDAGRAEEIVNELRRCAGRYWIEGRVDKVPRLGHDARALRLGRTYREYPVPDRPNSHYVAELVPVEGFVLMVDVGQGCESLCLGLARYPDEVWAGGKSRRTNLRGWRWVGFCKTQFASLHGWDHFRRCHLAVLDLLDAARELGCRVTVSDEGEYWPRRNEKALRRNVGLMNSAIAGAAGAMKDFYTAKGEPGVQSPIFAHPQYEHLEAKGASQRHVAALRKALE